MSTIETLRDNIKTRVTSVLGASYSEAPYGIDFLKNTQKGSSKIYAVVPQNIANSTTVTRSITYDQEFQVKFADTYINTSMSDTLQQSTSIVLLELAKDLFKDLVNTKCGSPAICLNVTDLEVQEPIHEDKSKMIIIEMSFLIKYRELI